MPEPDLGVELDLKLQPKLFILQTWKLTCKEVSRSRSQGEGGRATGKATHPISKKMFVNISSICAIIFSTPKWRGLCQGLRSKIFRAGNDHFIK